MNVSGISLLNSLQSEQMKPKANYIEGLITFHTYSFHSPELEVLNKNFINLQKCMKLSLSNSACSSLSFSYLKQANKPSNNLVTNNVICEKISKTTLWN